MGSDRVFSMHQSPITSAGCQRLTCPPLDLIALHEHAVPSCNVMLGFLGIIAGTSRGPTRQDPGAEHPALCTQATLAPAQHHIHPQQLPVAVIEAMSCFFRRADPGVG